MDTFDEVFGPDPNTHTQSSLSGPGGTVVTQIPAHLDTSLRGLSSLHPQVSPTPWVIALTLALVLLLHPKAGFNAGARVGR